MLGLHRLRHLHPWAIVVHFSGVATFVCLSFFFVGGNVPEPQTDVFLLLAIGATATVGQLFLTKAFTAGPPAKVSVVGLTQVVFALILDVCLWDHSFSAHARRHGSGGSSDRVADGHTSSRRQRKDD